MFTFIRVVFIAVRSRIYIFWYKHFYGVKFGRKVRIDSKLLIYGPGKIIIGDGTCFGSRLITNVLGTTNSNATIRIGKGCFLNGAAIAAAKSIDIGDFCIISDEYIMDTSSHGIAPNRRGDPMAAKVAPITLSENVWIGSKAFVMPGVKIGKNSIIGVNSVPENVFAAGVPAKVIDKLEGMHD